MCKDGGNYMTKSELLKRLEAISIEIDKLNETVIKKSRNDHIEMLKSIEQMELELTSHMNKVEKVINELETMEKKKQNRVFLAMAR